MSKYSVAQADADRTRLWQVCTAFVQKNEIGGSETIHQCDHVISNAYTLIEQICQIVGYYREPQPLAEQFAALIGTVPDLPPTVTNQPNLPPKGAIRITIRFKPGMGWNGASDYSGTFNGTVVSVPPRGDHDLAVIDFDYPDLNEIDRTMADDDNVLTVSG